MLIYLWLRLLFPCPLSFAVCFSYSPPTRRVATQIAEEGLDIGQVDLIIAFDSVGSPLRIVQRFGRTGRKRKGRCVTLVSAGKEDNNYEKAKKSHTSLIKQLVSSSSLFIRNISIQCSCSCSATYFLLG